MTLNPNLLSTYYHFNSAIDFIPIHVLYESVDVFRGGGTIIHMIRVFVHIEDQQRIAHCGVVHVIPGPIVVNFAGVHVVRKKCPARATTERIGSLLKLRFPLLVASKPLLDQIKSLTTGFAITAKVAEIVF